MQQPTRLAGCRRRKRISIGARGLPKQRRIEKRDSLNQNVRPERHLELALVEPAKEMVSPQPRYNGSRPAHQSQNSRSYEPLSHDSRNRRWRTLSVH